MNKLEFIVENYKRLSTEALVEIASDPAALELEIIPHLQSELFNRNRKEEALALSEYLVRRPKALKDFSKSEIREKIRERIDSGEPAESIKLDLKDSGVDLFEVLNDESQLKDKTLEYLTNLKEEGLEDTQIEEKMKTAFGVTETEVDILKKELKQRGMQNLVIGYSLVIIMGLLSLATLGTDHALTIGGVLLFGIGVWRIVEGYRQRR